MAAFDNYNDTQDDDDDNGGYNNSGLGLSPVSIHVGFVMLCALKTDNKPCFCCGWRRERERLRKRDSSMGEADANG